MLLGKYINNIMAHIAHKYKLLPTKTQEKTLAQMGGSTRWLWNYMLDLNQKTYQETKKFVFAIDMANLLPELKSQNIWLKDTPSQSLQQKCIDLDRSLKSVWKSGFGFPKFKAKHKSSDSFRIPQNSKGTQIRAYGTHLFMPKLGKVKWVMHRPLPENSKIKSITITKDIDDWFVSVLLEIPNIEPMKYIDANKTVGLDLGVASFATLSDGTKIESPNFLKKSLRKLKHYQRQLKHKTKGSNNIKKQYTKIAKIHRDIRNARMNWLHHQSKDLVSKYDVICIENLKIKDLLEKKQMSRSIADQGWGIFVSHLQYKAVLSGKHVTKIGTYEPSTKTCSCCGNIRSMKLSDRVYVCENPKCNDYLKAKDRDINAATNIHFWGLMATEGVSFVSNTDGISEINACGDTITCQSNIIDEVSMKQEARRSLVVV